MKKFFIFYAILISCLLFSCQEYSDHFKNSQDTSKSIYTQNQEYSFLTGTLLSFPDENKYITILEQIQNARERIWIEIYEWTKIDEINTALVEAKNRGVDIRILLEGNVYGSPTININQKKFFETQGIPVKYTDNDHFTFTHAKFWIIDDRYSISTGNFTKSFFTKNREYIYTWKENAILSFLEHIFLRDYAWEIYNNSGDIPREIVLSPLNAREKIQSFILWAKESISIYVQTLSDNDILSLLENKKHEWIQVFICTANNEDSLESKEFSDLSENWKHWINPYLHAKIMVRDWEIVFLGSQNFTTNALNNNREMGIVGKNKDFSTRLVHDMSTHCQ